jgi:hypothetical protein
MSVMTSTEKTMMAELLWWWWWAHEQGTIERIQELARH